MQHVKPQYWTLKGLKSHFLANKLFAKSTFNCPVLSLLAAEPFRIWLGNTSMYLVPSQPLQSRGEEKHTPELTDSKHWKIVPVPRLLFQLGITLQVTIMRIYVGRTKKTQAQQSFHGSSEIRCWYLESTYVGFTSLPLGEQLKIPVWPSWVQHILPKASQGCLCIDLRFASSLKPLGPRN